MNYVLKTNMSTNQRIREMRECYLMKLFKELEEVQAMDEVKKQKRISRSPSCNWTTCWKWTLNKK